MRYTTVNEQINFSDIFKSSFIEKTTSFSLTDSIIGLVLAFLIGLFIYVVYKKTFNGVIYSHSFNMLRKALDLRGLSIASAWFSAHLTTDGYERTAAEFIAHRDFLHEMGAKVIVVS